MSDLNIIDSARLVLGIPTAYSLNKNIRQLVTHLITKRELKAYSVAVDITNVIEDNEDRLVTEVLKGVRLTEIDTIEMPDIQQKSDTHNFLRYKQTGNLYYMRLMNDTYNRECYLYKLNNAIDLRSIRKDNKGLQFPEKSINARLVIVTNWHEYSKQDTILRIEGENTELIQILYNMVANCGRRQKC